MGVVNFRPSPEQEEMLMKLPFGKRGQYIRNAIDYYRENKAALNEENEKLATEVHELSSKVDQILLLLKRGVVIESLVENNIPKNAEEMKGDEETLAYLAEGISSVLQPDLDERDLGTSKPISSNNDLEGFL